MTIARLRNADGRWGTIATGCSIFGCARPHKSRGMCSVHYDRHRRTGIANGKDEVIAKIRQRLMERPTTCTQLAQETGVVPATARKIAVTLGAQIVFRLGRSARGGQDAYYTLQRLDIVHAWSALWEAMKKRPQASYTQLGNASGMGTRTACRHITQLHILGLVHISGWSLVERKYGRLWSFGPGVDVPKPSRKTRRERHLASMVRKRTEAKVTADENDPKSSDEFRPRRDPLVAALFGAAA